MSIENLKKILESEREFGADEHAFSGKFSNNNDEAGNAFGSYKTGSKDMENRLLPLLQKAVEMAEFYADGKHLTENDSEVIIVNASGILIDDHIVGKKAREFLTNVSEFTEGILSLSETTESVSEFTKMTEIKKESV